MKPNFAQMSTKELRAYVLAHREDIEALEILFSRRTPDSEAIIYPSMFTENGQPIEENIGIIEEAITSFSFANAQRVQQEKNNQD
ncbi:MAG: hypothetical protein KME32_14125 [Mojavia pulchra JT2-VF2]|uniref:Uncharacterized protein n=1 Tax=Mojavia pulchra JT2-VF2 TaxID=287848 RepID=A0A951UGQ2_9NOST|nr:hypothetical protein [Mojavia pulchra JT2-VF2]